MTVNSPSTARPIAARRSWLCPTDADVQRFYDALEGINRGRRQVLVILFGFGAVMTYWMGRPNLVLITAAAIVGFTTDLLATRRRSTVLSGVVVSAGFQVMLSFGVAITGGLQSPYLCWLTVPVTMLAARYRRAVVQAAIAVALLLGWLACLLADVLGTARDPSPTVFGVAVVALTCALGAIALNLQSAEIQSRIAATSDPLTGLFNRKALDSQFARVTGEVALTGGSVAVLMLDLDHFKAVNDTYGHAAGDDVLRETAQILTGAVRPDDRVFRMGGEEFLVLLPHADARLGAAVAERVRGAVAAAPVAGLDLTVSVGVAVRAAQTVDQRDIVEAADRALYAAKTSGRDRVVLDAGGGPVGGSGTTEPGATSAHDVRSRDCL